MNQLFATCVYEELNPSSTLKIVLSKDGEEFKVFEHSDPLVVWFEYSKWLNTENEYYIVWSSTKDHWFMDTDDYFEKYFDPETGEFINWCEVEMYDVEARYPSCVVNSEMKNFWDLKEYVKGK
jgi:hypothetical protein